MAYYVYHGSASEADPYDTWAKAAHSLQALDTAKAFASGDVIYIANDHVDPTTAAGNLTITGPTSGAPTIIISAERAGTTYTKSVTNQIDTTAGAYSITFDGSFALYGLRAKSGANITVGNDGDESFLTYECDFAPAANGYVIIAGGNGAATMNYLLNIDLSADASSNRSGSVLSVNAFGRAEVLGLTFLNTSSQNTAQYRTGTIFYNDSSPKSAFISNADFSGFTNATTCEIWNGGYLESFQVFANCKTVSSPIFISTQTATRSGIIDFYNCGSADNPVALVRAGMYGYLASTDAIYRTGGGTVEATATSWLITTTSACSEGSPFCAPWIYGVLSSTGSKTFDVYITNDTADFTDAEVWLEVEYFGTSDSPLWTLASDHRATITTTAAAQTNDGDSVWVGLNDAAQGLADYMQKLSVTATVNESEGQFRARVAVGLASIASSRYFYVDPKVTVTAV